MTLISDAYRRANEMLHKTTVYGTTAPRFMDAIRTFARNSGSGSILDYGSGPREYIKHGFLKDREIPEIGELMRQGVYRVQSYDPCVAHLAGEPEPADMVVSCDVLEHIEPELLDNVLDHMRGLTRKAAFLSIATGPAKKVLPDGRNAHLIQEGSEFWLPRVMQRWRLRHFQDIEGELVCFMEARP